MRVAFSDTIVFDKFLISPKLYILIFCCSTATYNTNASKCRHWKTIKYYTDQHDVDENRNTIPVYGGMWIGDRATSDGNGIYRRDMYDPVDTASYTVASLKNIGHSR